MNLKGALVATKIFNYVVIYVAPAGAPRSGYRGFMKISQG